MLLPVPAQLGYVALGALILGESAGLPLPGETALITAGGLVAAGQLALPLVILVATLAALLGPTGSVLLAAAGLGFGALTLAAGWWSQRRSLSRA